jgi:opacity protein-like surface antigen
VDPILAVRGHVRLTDRIGLTAYADIGGFQTGSQLTWQAVGALDWQITSSIVAQIGWRYIYIDYSKDNVTVDMDLSGPFLGATFRF